MDPHFTSAPDFRLDFLGIGAPKGGTTWLSAVLGAHPDIFTPLEKELDYFNRQRTEYAMENRNFHKPLAWYHHYFRAARPGQKVGEVNPVYMLDVTDPADLHRYHPGLQLIAILRDPIDRARSQFQFNSKWVRGLPPSFAQALEKHPELISQSEYGRLLTRYLDYFPRSQLLVLFHEDLNAGAQTLYNSVTRFLGVRDFTPGNLLERPNETREIRSSFLAGLLARSREWMFRLGLENMRPLLRRTGVLRLVNWLRDDLNAGPPPPKAFLPVECETRLRDRLRGDVETVERITGRDLSHWKQMCHRGAPPRSEEDSASTPVC